MSTQPLVVDPIRIQAMPFCFRHPRRVAVSLVAGDGFCRECWGKDEPKPTPPSTTVQPTVEPYRHFPRAKRLGGRPRGALQFRPKSWRVTGKYTHLGLALTKLRHKLPSNQPVRLELCGRSYEGLMVNAHTYAKRWSMKIATKLHHDGLYIWRTK